MEVHASFSANGERTLRVFQSEDDGEGGEDLIEVPESLAFHRVYLLFKFFEDASEAFDIMPTQNFRGFRRMAIQVNRFALFSQQIRPLHAPVNVRPTQRQLAGRRTLLADIFSSSPNTASLIFDGCVEFADGNGFEPIRRNVRALKELYLNSFQKPNMLGTFQGQNGDNATRFEAERIWLNNSKVHVSEEVNNEVLAWLSNQNSPLTAWVHAGDQEQDDEV